ncbi:MAG: hypothetical protein ACTS8R_00320 [Arsenophonus sp. NC-QC1-MAG3]
MSGKAILQGIADENHVLGENQVPATDITAVASIIKITSNENGLPWL